ncbi:TolC family protein [Ekhidna sp. To15]|uniref:TolC family protein n=1 Tax=Ekhidna sp. To15 TaxID=3395267 RepID=UPI003F5236A9
MKTKTGLITTLILLSFATFGQQKRVLSLEECIEVAIENNLNVKRSQLNLRTSEVNLEQSKASRYPSLNASGNYGFNWGRGIDPTTNQFIDQRINFNSVGASTNMPLIQGLQITNGIKQDKLSLEASKKDLEKAENDISLNTASFYLNVIFNKELSENARFQLESSQQQLERTTILVESGALPLANKLQLESQVATNEVNLINAQNNLDLALLSLKQALLLPSEQEIDVEIPNVPIDQAEIERSSIAELYNQAVANMPEIQGAELRVQSADVGVEVAKGGMYPTVTLSGSMDTRYSDAAQQIDPISGDFETIPLSTQYDNNFSRGLSANLRIPIFNGFSTRSNIQRSKISLQQAEISKREQENTLYQTIETSYRNAVAAAKTFTASQKQVASLEETFRAVENQYNNGAANFTDYQVASNNLFQARSDLSRAKFDFIFKQKVLEFYQGKPLTF